VRVTALRASRLPGYVAVSVDGARFGLLPIERVRALGLVRGRELDETAAGRLEAAMRAEDAYRAAVRLLAARPRAVGEVMRRLRQKKMTPQAASEAVGRLEAAGLLDDGEFARSFARSRAERGYGPARTLADLAAKGVDRRVAEAAVAEVTAGEGDRMAEIEELARKRARQMGDLPAGVRTRRIAGYLMRRGYAIRDVRRVLEQVLAT